MSNNSKSILVFGATGRQGGGVAQKLLDDGWHVKAVTHNPGKSSTVELKRLGAEIVQADMNDKSSLLKAMEQVYGVYSVQPLYPEDPEKEIEHGKNVADAAQESNISHFIYGSVSGAERDSGVPHFEKKWEIEKYLRSIDIPFTIIRPAFFMENFKNFTESQGERLNLQGFIEEHIKLKMISVQDIGSFTSVVLNNPEEYINKSLNIAGDELNLKEVANVFQEEFKVECDVQKSAREKFQKNKMFQWYETEGYQADIPKLREIYPDLLDLSSWVRQSEWNPLKDSSN